MKTAKELYEEEGYFYQTDYQPMLDEFGDILVQVDDEGYQGDSRVLYHDGKRFGWLQFGWGSCSGCDALQACNSVEEVQELMDELHNSIMWFDGPEEAIKFFESHDWEGDYSWWADEQREFIQLSLKTLRDISAQN